MGVQRSFYLSWYYTTRLSEPLTSLSGVLQLVCAICALCDRQEVGRQYVKLAYTKLYVYVSLDWQ